jgi:hypothetical protein
LVETKIEPAPQSIATQASVAKTEASVEFAAGARVSVPTHGEGRVVRVEGDKLVVAFPDGEPRMFKAEFVEPAGGARKRRSGK